MMEVDLKPGKFTAVSKVHPDLTSFRYLEAQDKLIMRREPYYIGTELLTRR